MKDKKVVIATHNSKFHADDVFSLVILKKFFGEVKAIRTRDEEVLKKADIRVDVGGKYSHKTKDYDHHQEGSPVRENGLPYASCGLIWKHYGKKLVNSERAFDYIEKVLVEYVDAMDNGVEIKKSDIYSLSIGEGIELFNSNWNEDSSNENNFDLAVEFASLFFDRLLLKANSIYEGEKILDKDLKKMKEGIIVLSGTRLPKDKLPSSNAEVFVEKTTVGTWIAVTVPVEPKSFIRKKYFPKKWAGLLGGELENVSGIKCLTFCHKHRFIVAADTKEAAIAAAKKVVKD